MRRLSDQICLENGLPVIEQPKLSKGWNRSEYLGDKKPPAARERLQDLMDNALTGCKNPDDFLAALEAAGVEVKRGKQLAFKLPDGKKFSRQDTLGDDYSYDAVLERISGKRTVAPKQTPAGNEYKPSLLIDIQAKIQQGKGAGYEHWARIFNLKEAAKTLLFLKENGINSYDELLKKSAAVSAGYNERLNKIKAIDKRLGEITELQKHFSTYGKTLDVYKQYKRLGGNEKFYVEHRADITLHMTAKKHFDSLGYGKNDKKLPKITELKQEYATLFAEKKKLYSGWHELKETRMALLTAKYNADRILGINPNSQNLDGSLNQKRNSSHDR